MEDGKGSWDSLPSAVFDDDDDDIYIYIYIYISIPVGIYSSVQN